MNKSYLLATWYTMQEYEYDHYPIALYDSIEVALEDIKGLFNVTSTKVFEGESYPTIYVQDKDSTYNTNFEEYFISFIDEDGEECCSDRDYGGYIVFSEIALIKK